MALEWTQCVLSATLCVGRGGRLTLDGLIWHRAVREQSSGERLFYIRFSVDKFDSEPFAAALSSWLLERSSPVRSYAVYETTGRWDYFLRCWLPVDTSPDAFEADLTHSLSEFGVDNVQYFNAFRTLRHHAFRAESDEVVQFTDGEIDLSGIDILQIDQFNAEVSEAVWGALKKRASTPGAGDPAPIPVPVSAVDAIDRGYLAPLPLFGRGVRFNIVFSHPREPLTRAQREDIDRRLNEACSKALARARTEYGQGESARVSIYSGQGTLTNHLIVARSPDGHFYSFLRNLLEQIYGSGVTETYRIKPSTTVYGSREAVSLRERISSPSEFVFDESNIESLEEDHKFELKASAWLDVRNWFETGIPNQSFDAGTTGIAKAICGMLNNDGGAVAVGIAEASRLSPKGVDTAELVAWAEENALPFTEDGELLIVGLEAEYRNTSKKGVEDWDSWIRLLQDAITKRIEPDPFRQLLVTFQQVELSDRYNNQVIAVIVATPPTDRSIWFYIEGEFYVRQQGKNEPLHGSGIDEYRRSKQRNQ